MSMLVQKLHVYKMAKRLCLVDDLKMLKITMSNSSSRNKLNPEINDHYNILTGECQKDKLKTKDKAYNNPSTLRCFTTDQSQGYIPDTYPRRIQRRIAEDDPKASEEEDDDEEEEDHLALFKSSVVPIDDPVPSVEETKPFETNKESSAAAATRQPGFDVTHATDYREGTDHFGGVEPKSDKFARDTHKMYVWIDDTRMNELFREPLFNMLFKIERYHLHTAMLLESEARHAQQTWSQAMDYNKALHAELLAYRAEKMAPKRNTSTTPMTVVAIKALITQGVATALVEHEANRSRNRDDSHDSGSGGRRQIDLLSGWMFPEVNLREEKYVGGQFLTEIQCRTKVATIARKLAMWPRDCKSPAANVNAMLMLKLMLMLHNQETLANQRVITSFDVKFRGITRGLTEVKETRKQGNQARIKQEHLKLILDLLKKEELHAKFSKCKFWIPKVQFLGDKEEAAFQLLKQKLCSAPILALPEGAENFIVYCDASHKGLGAFLMQNEKVIAYASRQLKIHEKNYTTHDLELGTVVFTLKIWRHYLYGTNCIVFTNHKSLQHILDQKELNMRQCRWLECSIKARKPENFEAEDVGGMIRKEKLEPRADKTLSFQKALGTRLVWSMLTILLTDGNIREGTIQTLEDMLRACVIDFGNGWDRHLPIIEFSYNNSYHTSIKAAPFEVLYGHKCRSPIWLAEVRDVQLTGLDNIHETAE
ncbi:putative reverse transcriptase domain-containing protein [Tanacetum coccineum]